MGEKAGHKMPNPEKTINERRASCTSLTMMKNILIQILNGFNTIFCPFTKGRVCGSGERLTCGIGNQHIFDFKIKLGYKNQVLPVAHLNLKALALERLAINPISQKRCQSKGEACTASLTLVVQQYILLNSSSSSSNFIVISTMYSVYSIK